MIYLILFLEFFKIGLFCFGGAFGMIPLIEETVLKYDWLTESEFYDFIGVCESTPGPVSYTHLDVYKRQEKAQSWVLHKKNK